MRTMKEILSVIVLIPFISIILSCDRDRDREKEATHKTSNNYNIADILRRRASENTAVLEYGMRFDEIKDVNDIIYAYFTIPGNYGDQPGFVSHPEAIKISKEVADNICIFLKIGNPSEWSEGGHQALIMNTQIMNTQIMVILKTRMGEVLAKVECMKSD